jgi:hypothetical protein
MNGGREGGIGGDTGGGHCTGVTSKHETGHAHLSSAKPSGV